MNGIKLKSRGKGAKETSNFKIFVCVLLSNLFLALLLYPAKETPQRPLSHKDMEKLLLPVKIFVPLPPGKREYPAALYDEKHKLITRPVFLHPDFTSIPSRFSDSIQHMQVEVEKKAVKHLIGKNLFLVFPYQKEESSTKKRSVNYEIVF